MLEQPGGIERLRELGHNVRDVRFRTPTPEPASPVSEPASPVSETPSTPPLNPDRDNLPMPQGENSPWDPLRGRNGPGWSLEDSHYNCYERFKSVWGIYGVDQLSLARFEGIKKTLKTEGIWTLTRQGYLENFRREVAMMEDWRAKRDAEWKAELDAQWRAKRDAEGFK